jgi:hypothetical protein
VLVFSTDLSATNLPITVDFPVLLRNMIAEMQRLPSPLVHDWRTVGQLIESREFGALVSVTSPEGEGIPLHADQLAILTEEPGFYAVTTRDGVMPVAINIDPVESLAFQDAVSQIGEQGSETATKEILRRLWPYFAVLLLILLIAESLIYVRSEMLGGRT